MLKRFILISIFLFPFSLLASQKNLSLELSFLWYNKTNAAILYELNEELSIGPFYERLETEDYKHESCGLLVASESKITDKHSFILGFGVGSTMKENSPELVVFPTAELRKNFGNTGFIGSGVHFYNYFGNHPRQALVTPSFTLGLYL